MKIQGTKYPSNHVKASNSDYFYWIFQDKSTKVALYKGRASSLSECRDMLNYYKQQYGTSCVITVKELGFDKWICTRANNL